MVVAVLNAGVHAGNGDIRFDEGVLGLPLVYSERPLEVAKAPLNCCDDEVLDRELRDRMCGVDTPCARSRLDVGNQFVPSWSGPAFCGAYFSYVTISP